MDGIKSMNNVDVNDGVNGTSAYATTNLMGSDYNGGGGSSSLEGRNRSVSAAVSDVDLNSDFGSEFHSVLYQEYTVKIYNIVLHFVWKSMLLLISDYI